MQDNYDSSYSSENTEIITLFEQSKLARTAYEQDWNSLFRLYSSYDRVGSHSSWQTSISTGKVYELTETYVS